MAKRLHRAPFHQAISGAPCPGVEPCIRELHSPAEMADQGGKAALINPSEPGFGAEVIDQNDLAVGLDDAGELVERSLRIRHRRDHVLRHQDRKSTRLNSSHLVISYAVFCLKKQNTPPIILPLTKIKTHKSI